WIEQAIELGAAGAQIAGEGLLGLLLLLHDLRELPGEDALYGNGFDLFADALLVEEAVEGGAFSLRFIVVWFVCTVGRTFPCVGMSVFFRPFGANFHLG